MGVLTFCLLKPRKNVDVLLVFANEWPLKLFQKLMLYLKMKDFFFGIKGLGK